MSVVIWKYDLGSGPRTVHGRKVLAFDLQPLSGTRHQNMCAWVLVDPDDPEQIELGLFGTGQPIPDDWPNYGGTVVAGADLVLHLWWRRVE